MADLFLYVKQLWFLWLPAVLACVFWASWLSQTRAKYLKNTSWVLLEMKIPRDVAKSPRAMEAVLSSLYSVFTGSWWMRAVKGFLQSWYSLEIASINGNVRFFIYTQKFFRNLVESQIYAQYPNAEIVEIDDYVYASDFENLEEWNLWGAEIGLAKEDAYPIKTYVDFGLHETMTKEEQKVNPLVSFLEFLGSLKEGEQLWFQVAIKGAGKGWIEEGKKIIDELMGRNAPPDSDGNRLSKGEQEVVGAIEKNISRQGFDTGMRIIYLARKDVFNFANIGSIFGLLNQYNTQNLNGFKPNRTTATGFLFRSKRELFNKKIILDAYRHRGYFYAPYKRKTFVFNVEELATIYHFPGRVAETPTFERLESRKGAPPTNLPV
ncbi:hypothetical protein KKA27_02300 [Patescibacteria group bacterium]|nr:hypothetical protein [Patescibacteria group bacterium]MBU2633047.1 hypothetical protein [Patescibacteria group bacterium]